MAIYVTREGTKLTASSPTELVEQLFRHSPTETLQDFMERMSRHFQAEDKITIRTDDPEIFIADLIQNDYLKVVDTIDG
jgi:hypothetical protein